MNATAASITAIVRAVEFVESHLQEEIAIADMADAAYYSLFHFCRMFNAVVHHTPYDYLMRRRLSEAARELVQTDKKVIEIAFDYQFNSPETFTRAFKRMFSVQPNQWRKQGKLPTRALMPILTQTYLTHLNQGDALKPVLIEKEAFYLAGLMTIVANAEDDKIPLLWELFTQLITVPQTATNTPYYSIAWYPDDWEQAGYFYMVGVEVSSLEHLAAGCVVKVFPPAHYARFIHKGTWRERQLTIAYIYHTWLVKSGKKLVAPIELEYHRQPDEWDVLIPLQ
jgi:AraC family transcriptional regulator